MLAGGRKGRSRQSEAAALLWWQTKNGFELRGCINAVMNIMAGACRALGP